MPFVPLRSRSQLQVILDADKDAITAKQRAKDHANVSRHYQLAPSAGGYRFGSHAATLGIIRGPESPFKGASSPWRPPSAERDGPAGQRASGHQSWGAYWEASHCMRKVQSSPELKQEGQRSGVELAKSVELARWEKLASKTENVEMKEMYPHVKKQLEAPQPKKLIRTPGLVNFPKYLLIHDCHLKRVDKQRFVEQESRARAEYEQALADAEARGGDVPEPPSPEAFATQRTAASGPQWRTARFADTAGIPWAGSTLPAGAGSRTSNPLRLG